MKFIIPALFIVIVAIFVKICMLNKDKINFFTKGIDSKFRLREIRLLWKLSRECNLENPLSLYFSVPSLNRCISSVISDAQLKGVEQTTEIQSFLAKLYQFRTRIALDEEKNKGLDDTRSLDKGQRLRIVLKGKGVFLSEILNNGREIIISIPKQDNLIKIDGDGWLGKTISVYLWRKGDASYVFDSTVLNSGMFTGVPCLYLQHTDKLLRAQKRNSIRCECKIYAQMYILNTDVVDYNLVENVPGYRCLLEDISEDGAMIRIGGKGKTNVQIKLQFSLNDTFIMMFGVIRAVEYNEGIKQSRLHFECTHIEAAMKNAILCYVYNVIPPEQKEINEAIAQTESDALDSGESIETVAKANKNIEETIAAENGLTDHALTDIVDGAVKISVPSIPNADGASHSDDDIDDILPLESIDDGV